MGEAEHAVLVVDDDLDTCRNLSDILEDAGFRVDVAHDGPSALRLVEADGYDVALLDLKMPGMDGLTLYREIRKRSAETVAMIVTAYASGETRQEALSAGAWHVLPKPVDMPRLLGLVRKATEQPLILVVDDDHDLCASLWDVLRQEGYRTCLAHSESDAAGAIRDRAFHVVLIDMKLPGDDGTEVFRLVRQANPAARTILITGFRSEVQQAIEATLSEGADRVCYKPFDVPELLSTVQQLVEQSRRQA